MRKGGSRRLPAWRLFFLIGLGLFLTLLDQGTKAASVLYLKGKPPLPVIPGVFQLSYVENTGMAFGLLKGGIPVFLLGTLILFCLAAYALIRIPKTAYYLPLIVLGTFLLSGALGNFLDRCFRGYVVDFLYVSLIDFPVFNLADVYVVVSMVLLVLFLLFYYKEEQDFDFLKPGSRKHREGGM